MTAIYLVTFVMSAVLICKWTLSYCDDDDDDDDDRCKFVAVLQENVMDVKLEEYAVEAAQKAVDLCRAELYRLLVY